MRKTYGAGLVAVITFVVISITAGPASADRSSYNNWHVHDGGSGVDANGLVHRPPDSFQPSYSATIHRTQHIARTHMQRSDTDRTA
jgi:hypothetical protein